MKPLDQYPVTLPYGYTKFPYSSTRPHKGADRACPIGTPIIINGKIIALTGNTGDSSGPHCHTQAGGDITVQNTVNPAPHEFKGGIVVDIRTTDPGTSGSWGKYVKLKIGGIYIVYAHLSKINIAVGDVIGTMEKFNDGDRRNLNFWLYGEDRLKFSSAIGMPYKDAIGAIMTSPEYTVDAFVNNGDVPAIDKAYGRTDGKTQVGKTWKKLGYEYGFKYANSGNFVPVTEELYKKG